MRNAFKGLVAAAALAATGVIAAQPAQARDDTGAAVAAGVIGLGLGAAIASSNSAHYTSVGYYDGYPGYGYGYGRAYGYGRGYGYGDGYYGRPAYSYGRGYYGYDRRWERRRDRDRWERHHDRDWRDRRWR